MIDQDFLEVKKENKSSPNKNIIGVVVLVVFVLAGVIFFFGKKEKFEMPASFEIPLFEKTKITNVSQNVQEEQEIIFLSKASIVEVFKFYEDFAKKNGFVFVNTGLSERKQQSPENIGLASFTLTPMIGRTDLLTYFFILNPQGDKTEVKISYDSTIKKPSLFIGPPIQQEEKIEMKNGSKEQNNTDKEEEKIKLPKDFKLKL